LSKRAWPPAWASRPACRATIKTRAALYPQVEAAIRAAHSYELPEILAIPVAAGLPAYLDWLASESGPVASEPGDVMG
jgi:periplasmic divalent cation tolerance protein